MNKELDRVHNATREYKSYKEYAKTTPLCSSQSWLMRGIVKAMFEQHYYGTLSWLRNGVKYEHITVEDARMLWAEVTNNNRYDAEAFYENIVERMTNEAD